MSSVWSILYSDNVSIVLDSSILVTLQPILVGMIVIPRINHITTTAADKIFPSVYHQDTSSNIILCAVTPSLIPALQNIGILHHKKAKLPKHLQQSVILRAQCCHLSVIYFGSSASVLAESKL